MVRKTRKNKHRKSPPGSATESPEGTVEFGNDKKRWVVKKAATGVQRWVPFAHTELFGYKPLTVDVLRQHIGKSLSIYERSLSYMWPKGPKDFDVKYTFTASGDAELRGKQFEGWLKNQTPAVKKNDLFILSGTMKGDLDSTLQVGLKPDELISTNLMNSDAFVKVGT